MEWSKTKSILIIALIITNLVIGYFLLTSSDSASVRDEKKRVADMQVVLALHNIDVSSMSALTYADMPVITTTYTTYDLEAIAHRLFTDTPEKTDLGYTDGNYLISSPDPYTLTIEKLSHGLSQRVDYPDMREATLVAAAFIDKLGFAQDYNYNTTTLSQSDLEGRYIDYYQTYQDFFIEGAHMSVTINQGQVVAFTRKWLQVEEHDETTSIIPYSNALYRLISTAREQGDSSPLHIKSVNLGYSMTRTLFNSDIKSGQASPFYQFTSVTGQTYMVKALHVE